MAFTDYTSPDEVRAVLGISAKEVSDDKIATTVNLTTLLEALYKLAPTLQADFATAYAAAPRSAAQARFVLLVETFCAYTVAVAMIPGLPLNAPQIITDGKTAMNRVANPFEALLPALHASLGYFKINLMTAYTAVNSAIPVVAAKARVIVLGIATSIDPVTGA